MTISKRFGLLTMTVVGVSTFLAFANPASAKEWQFRAVDISNGTVKELAKGSTCNYASAVSAARKAAAPAGDNGAILLKGIDNPSCAAPAAPSPAEPHRAMPNHAVPAVP